MPAPPQPPLQLLPFLLLPQVCTCAVGLPAGGAAAISDFFDDADAILEGVRRLSLGGHEPIMFQVLDPVEIDFDLDGLTRFVGLEESGMQNIDPKAIREAYLAELEAHNQRLARQARAHSIDYVQLNTARSLEGVLSAYLARRGARARGGRS